MSTLERRIPQTRFIFSKINFIKERGFNPNHSEITMRWSTEANLSQSEAETMIKLVDTLEDLDDVQTVYSNAELSDDILEKI